MTYLTAKQVRELLQISDSTLRRYVRQGKIPAYRMVGVRDLRFEQADVVGLLVLVEPGTSTPTAEVPPGTADNGEKEAA